MEDKKTNLSTYIGIALIFGLLYVWLQISVPPKKTDDPAAQPTAEQPTATAPVTTAEQQPAYTPNVAMPTDSAGRIMLMAKFGPFAPAATGQEQFETLENDMMIVKFTNKGGRIREIRMKNFEKINSDSANNDVKSPVYLLEDAKNRFDYDLEVANTAAGKVNTADLYFTSNKTGNTITFRADAGEGRYLEQSYTLQPDNYQIDYQIAANNLQSVLLPGKNYLTLHWENYLDKIEKNQDYERGMSSVYFKTDQDSPDYCNCKKDVVENVDQPVRWFSHSHQFFNTSLVAKDFSFRQFVGETRMFTAQEPDLKLLKSTAQIPLDNPTVHMTMYAGPNEFERLRAYDLALEDIIPFGASIFGAINRWIIHPIFSFLSLFSTQQGILILLLTLIVKLLVYPLTYRMVKSQARMAALKPQLESLKKKHGADQQAMSVETMKLYSEFRVNPLGGCLPVLLQMPIWFALYRFFPASIEFRQAGFLWATDLSSYDVAFRLPYMVPGFGNHISAFTLIWVVTTLWYTWYSMKQMDNSSMQNEQMKMMKWMQYLMPVMFLFFFNTFASGLTLYLCFSNILNIGQTVVTKKFLIDHEKIKLALDANRNKPKKTGGWRDRFEQAMKEQQKIQAEKAKQPQQPAKKK